MDALEPQVRPRRGLLGLSLGFLIAFLLGLAGAAWAVHRWDAIADLLRPPAAAPAPAPVAPVVAARPAPAPVPPAPEPEDSPELTSRVADLESRIGQVEQRSAAAAGDADRAEALLVAFAARRALDRGHPLGYLEGLLRDRYGAVDPPAVAQVIAAAQRPVTLAQLQDGLDALAPELATAEPESNWWTAFRRELGGLFVVRPAGTPSALPDERLRRARHALDQGMVDVAAAEVARMPGAARAQAWLALARRYQLARNALDRIETAALLKPQPRSVAQAEPAPPAAPAPPTTTTD